MSARTEREPQRAVLRTIQGDEQSIPDLRHPAPEEPALRMTRRPWSPNRHGRVKSPTCGWPHARTAWPKPSKRNPRTPASRASVQLCEATAQLVLKPSVACCYGSAKQTSNVNILSPLSRHGGWKPTSRRGLTALIARSRTQTTTTCASAESP